MRRLARNLLSLEADDPAYTRSPTTVRATRVRTVCFWPYRASYDVLSHRNWCIHGLHRLKASGVPLSEGRSTCTSQGREDEAREQTVPCHAGWHRLSYWSDHVSSPFTSWNPADWLRALRFAWTGRPSVHWIAPEIGLAIIGAALLTAYMAIFSHLADVYETYASSALAAQSLARNLCVGIYVLFAQPMYRQFPRPAGSGQTTSYALASTLLAGVGLVLGTVPFILYRYGEGLRRRSKVASQIWATDKQSGGETRSEAVVKAAERHEDINMA